jgi:hypothetical protein
LRLPKWLLIQARISGVNSGGSEFIIDPFGSSFAVKAS